MSDLVKCSRCETRTDLEGLCSSCLSNKLALDRLNLHIRDLEKEIEEFRREIKVSDQLIEQRDRLLQSIPECPVHGSGCIPHAIEWVNRIKTLGQAITGLKEKQMTISIDEPGDFEEAIEVIERLKNTIKSLKQEVVELEKEVKLYKQVVLWGRR